MKVCLRRGYHHVFDDLIKYPPSNVEYTIPKFSSSHGQSGVSNVLKRRLWRLYANTLNRPNEIRVNCPEDASLIHSNSGFLIKNDKPWVTDVEHAASFVGFEVGRLEKVRPVVEQYLTSKNCKKVMPWTKAGEKSIKSSLSWNKIKDKVEVVYPAMTPLKVKKKKHEGVNLLFVSYRFFSKGGKELLEAADKLKDKYDFNLTIVSEVPESYQKKYPDFEYQKPNLPRSVVLNKYFANADAFVLPSYMDTFGMVYLEAMSAGIPIVSTNVFALPEMIGKAGLYVDPGKYSWYGKDNLFNWKSWDYVSKKWETDSKPKITNQLVTQLSKIIESKSLRNRLAKTGKKEIGKGKFSIETRNKKLKRIYEEASKN